MLEINWYTEKCIETLKQINNIWKNLDVDDKYHKQLIEAKQIGHKEKFLQVLDEFERYNTRRVEEYIHELRIETSKWPDDRKAFLKARIDMLIETGMHKWKAIQVAYCEMNNFK